MNRIVDLRKQHKISQIELAKNVGCTQAAVSYYEKGERKIPQDVLTRLCEIFDCTSDYLLGISDINAKSPAAVSGAGDIPEEFKRLQEANELYLQLDEAGRAQALAYLKFLASQR